MKAELAKLKAIEERIYTLVCDVRGYVTKQDNDTLEHYRKLTGQSWNSAMQRFEPCHD